MSMNLMIGTQRSTADAQVGAGSRPCRVYWIHLVSGGTASTTSLENATGTGGDDYIQVDGKANESVTLNFAGGVLFPEGCYMNTDANISYCVIGFSEEN